MNSEALNLIIKIKESAVKLKNNKYDHMWLKNELIDDWSHGSPYEYFALLSNYHEVINLCENVERIYQINEDSTKLIEAFCIDDTEWHKLLDKMDKENTTLIGLVIKLTDKCIEMQNELERINNLKPVVYASEKDISDLKIFTYLFAEKQSSESANIPLYRLDKRL